jgi:hypothetical protein
LDSTPLKIRNGASQLRYVMVTGGRVWMTCEDARIEIWNAVVRSRPKAAAAARVEHE